MFFCYMQCHVIKRDNMGLHEHVKNVTITWEMCTEHVSIVVFTCE